MKSPPPTRAGSESQHVNQPALILERSGLLSVNVFNQYKKPSLTMSNCRSIEVSVTYPPTPSALPLTARCSSQTTECECGNINFQQPVNRRSEPCDPQERADLEGPESMASISRDANRGEAGNIFLFLHLPLELRLKIYSYLLPPRTHTIVTQHPYNGYIYNAHNVPPHSAQTFYPSTINPSSNNYTTYKVLNNNFRAEFPPLGIYPHILRICKQIKDEAEPLLYGSPGTVFDFGVHLEALVAFMGDRSQLARSCVRDVRIAREVPVELAKDESPAPIPRATAAADERWTHLCQYVEEELRDLRTVDLTVWSSNGSLHDFPLSARSSPSSVSHEVAEMKNEEEQLAAQWREWEWTRDLLTIGALRQAKVTWWGAGKGEAGFDKWLAGRMVGDEYLTRRMVREGVVVEGCVVFGGVQV